MPSEKPVIDNGKLRTFKTGATRDTAEGKIDPEAFLDPQVVVEFCRYMNRHRVQSDGSLREGDNWQKGFTRESIAKSMQRHNLDFWLMHRGFEPESSDHLKVFKEQNKERAMIEALCGIYFNAAAYMREVLIQRSLQ